MTTADLFGQSLHENSGAEGLPLITNSAGQTCVFVPGHLYKPNPLLAEKIGKITGPGALIDSERRFLASLIKHLGGESQVTPEQIPAAIKQGQVEYFLLRNIDRSPGATRFRVGDSNWFYPDFIFWMIDRSTHPQTQTLCYIDPKGLEMGARGGWRNHKLLSFIYELVKIGRRFPTAVVGEGTPVKLRFKGAFVSTSNYPQLQDAMSKSQDFHVYGSDQQDSQHFPSIGEFGRAGIFFDTEPNYIAHMMAWLCEGETVLDRVMASAVAANELPENALPADEIGAMFRYELRRHNDQIELALAKLVRYTLSATTLEQVVVRMQAKARKELLPHLIEKKGVIERLAGKITDPASIQNPCQVLYQWQQENCVGGQNN